jgi:hypothetical protein
MKVKVIDIPGRLKHVVFWCAGCGSFHGAPVDKWNGNDQEEPSIGGEMIFPTLDNPRCICSVYRGVVSWDRKSQHRLAGKSLPLQHEEAWRPVGVPWDQDGPPQPKAA